MLGIGQELWQRNRQSHPDDQHQGHHEQNLLRVHEAGRHQCHRPHKKQTQGRHNNQRDRVEQPARNDDIDVHEPGFRHDIAQHDQVQRHDKESERLDLNVILHRHDDGVGREEDHKPGGSEVTQLGFQIPHRPPGTQDEHDGGHPLPARDVANQDRIPGAIIAQVVIHVGQVFQPTDDQIPPDQRHTEEPGQIGRKNHQPVAPLPLHRDTNAMEEHRGVDHAQRKGEFSPEQGIRLAPGMKVLGEPDKPKAHEENGATNERPDHLPKVSPESNGGNRQTNGAVQQDEKIIKLNHGSKV